MCLSDASGLTLTEAESLSALLTRVAGQGAKIPEDEEAPNGSKIV